MHLEDCTSKCSLLALAFAAADGRVEQDQGGTSSEHTCSHTIETIQNENSVDQSTHKSVLQAHTERTKEQQIPTDKKHKSAIDEIPMTAKRARAGVCEKSVKEHSSPSFLNSIVKNVLATQVYSSMNKSSIFTSAPPAAGKERKPSGFDNSGSSADQRRAETFFGSGQAHRSEFEASVMRMNEKNSGRTRVYVFCSDSLLEMQKRYCTPPKDLSPLAFFTKLNISAGHIKVIYVVPYVAQKMFERLSFNYKLPSGSLTPTERTFAFYGQCLMQFLCTYRKSEVVISQQDMDHNKECRGSYEDQPDAAIKCGLLLATKITGLEVHVVTESLRAGGLYNNPGATYRSKFKLHSYKSLQRGLE